jgi:hypothetical protein
MGNNKNPNQKRRGEKQPGTFHYNPGNMSGKTKASGNLNNKSRDKKPTKTKSG